MSFVLRAARPGDLDALCRLAGRTGGGFTNLPPDRAALAARLAWAEASFARDGSGLGDDLFLFVLADGATGDVRGTCQIIAQVGTTWPFHSYRLTAVSQHSKELGRTIRTEMLVLSTDYDGASEVGGLFLMPGERATGAGTLLARSRYLFMKMHRERFAARTIAELRGTLDAAGESPFWDGTIGRFFAMSFGEAEAYQAVHGNQFIADLIPKHPIYTALLPETARAAIGVAHTSGRGAQRMLAAEGFAYDDYVDIFDGGPTMAVATDRIATIRAAHEDAVVAIADEAWGEGTDSLVACGRLGAFRAGYGRIAAAAGGVRLDAAAAAALGVGVGDAIAHVPR